MKRIYALLVLTLVGCGNSPEKREAVSSPAAPIASDPIALEGTGFEAAALVQLPVVAPTDGPGLHNVYWLGDSIISGGEPEGTEALETLAGWGVKTILSVDGKVPDAETAARLGMRYVHVPIQYSGIGVDETLAIAKTFRELPGPFYVHCFHGKHRGPAAAAIGRVVLDGVSRERALAEMRQWCATSAKYEGLFMTIATAVMPSAEETQACGFAFNPAHSFTGLRGAMVEMARKWDLVKAASKRDWTPDPEHPDVDPVREAIQLHRVFETLAALDEMQLEPDDFRAWLEDGRSGSEALARVLTEGVPAAGAEPTWRAELDSAYARVAGSCTSCHAEYRD